LRIVIAGDGALCLAAVADAVVMPVDRVVGIHAIVNKDASNRGGVRMRGL
jgi:hypothetical protein